MTETCLPIVQWLKNWFTPSDEDYKYAMQVINPSDSTYAYNPHIDDVIRVGITVTDADGNNVPNHTFTLKWSEPQSDAYSTTLTTNSSGFAYYDYTCNKFGLITFRVNDNNIQIKVGGWKTYFSDVRWTVQFNETTTKVTLASTVSVNVTTTETQYGTAILGDNWLRPSRPMMFLSYNGNVIVIARDGNAKLSHRTISGSVTMSSQYFQIEWHHKGLPDDY